jgi:hypothetical protein
MKSTLGGLEASRMNAQMVERFQDAPHDRSKATPFVRPFQLSPDLLEEALAGDSFTRFTVVREPAQRLLSGYLEKIQQGLQQSEPIVEALKANGQAVAAKDITLEQFLTVVCAQDSRDQDPHFRRQADHLGIGIVEYDAIFNLADLDTKWGEIGALVGEPDLEERFFCRNQTKAATRMDDYYTPELLELVARSYADDYSLLTTASAA